MVHGLEFIILVLLSQERILSSMRSHRSGKEENDINIDVRLASHIPKIRLIKVFSNRLA